MSCPSNPAPLRPFIPIPCPGIRHARNGGGVGDGGGCGGGGRGGGNDDGCDGGVMTAKRNKSDQELRVAFIIVFLYIYYFVECTTCEIRYSLLRTDFKCKNSFLQNELYDGNIQFKIKFSTPPFILSYLSSVSLFLPLHPIQVHCCCHPHVFIPPPIWHRPLHYLVTCVMQVHVMRN